MPRTIWEWLEIEETTDRSLIRKAYARQAAKYHPEEAPEEAQQLREAYKRALALADRKAGVPNPGQNIQSDASEEVSEAFPERVYEPHRYDTEPQEEQESGAGSYQYGHPEERKEQEESGQVRSSRCDHQEGRKESEQESEQVRSYQYGHPEERKEEEGESGQSRSYRYSHPEEQKEAEPESEQTRSYRYGHYEERKGTKQEAGPMPDKDYQYQPRQIDAERAERTRRLVRRFIDLYESPAYRYSGRLWSEAVKEYLVKEDLQDPLVIAALISLLGRMPRLDHRVWNVLERELFRYARKEAEWIQLKQHFKYVRNLGVKNGMEQESPYSESQSGQTEKPDGAGTKVPRKTKSRLFRVIVAAVAVSMIYMGNKFQKEQEQQHRIQEMVNSISKEELITQRYDTSSYIRDHVLLSDYYIDLNDDGYDDLISYDQESSCFIVEYYDPITGEYVFQGTIDQYLEENPDHADSEQLLYIKSLSSQE